MRHEIETRVCLDDLLGPLDCKLIPSHHGWAIPSFTLAVVRELSAQTIRIADDYGYADMDTIHVIDGRTDGPNTVHIIDSGLTREINDEGDREPVALAVHVPWGALDKGATVTITKATPAAFKAARKTARKAARLRKTGSDRTARAVVLHAPWQWLMDDSASAASLVTPDRDGRYCVGGRSWAWLIATWRCACGNLLDWHEIDCLCGLLRDGQPDLAAVTVEKVAATLRTLVPEATSALVDFASGLARVTDVFAGDTPVDMADDTGPFDTETLGDADEILRKAVDVAHCLNDLVKGWEHVPHERTPQLYRIAFPTAGQ